MMVALTRLWRHRRVRWLAALVLVALLVLLAVATVVGRANRQQADDPRSTTAAGAGALGQLLRDEGVQLTTTDQVGAAVTRVTPSTTLVVAMPDRLDAAAATRLLAAPAARLVLLRPGATALDHFGLRAQATVPGVGVLHPGCEVGAARQAGAVAFGDVPTAYRPTGPLDFACYPTGNGFGYLRVSTAAGRPVELLAGGLSNRQLGDEGNAALGMNVLGSQPEVVWLMARPSEASTAAKPTLLPPWWSMAVVQAFLGLVLVGIWRGRRLGPILTEPLPVTVRASETVEGHGRLYERLNARDRAAEALRSGSRTRLSRVFGHAEDPLALSEVLAARTGRDSAAIRRLLFGPAPQTDDNLVELTLSLDRLEQEARQP